MKNLGRVNLLVGTNNSGKTTVLEAINILMANGDFTAIWSTHLRRGEDFYGERDPVTATIGRQVDIRRLFRGHEIEVGKYFQISADSDFGGFEIIASWPISVARMGTQAIRGLTRHDPPTRPPSPGFSSARCLGRP